MTSGSVSTSPNPSSLSISLDVEQTKSDENVTAEESEKAEQEISYYKSTSTWYWYTSFLIDQANCSIVRISYCWSSKTQKTILRCDLCSYNSGLHFGITAWCFYSMQVYILIIDTKSNIVMDSKNGKLSSLTIDRRAVMTKITTNWKGQNKNHTFQNGDIFLLCQNPTLPHDRVFH